ncbi:hypothetical protein IQ07DRAFT_640371 [Pyrenochaeta sp. DS3sAY3a]|nr:hypothetical protein IQ07DRAFT_640371 [Pyrenochaeta sp. DS3sAY3a]
MAQAQDAKKEENRGLRKAFRKWKDGLKSSNHKSPSQSPPSSINPPQPQVPAKAPSIKFAQIPPAGSPPTVEGVALFKPTTQTTIHSPLDKRNKPSISLTSSASLRKSYLGSRRTSAPADYFGPAATAGGGIPSFAETAALEHGKPPTALHSRRSSRLRFSLSKRSSVLPSHPETTQSNPSTTISSTPRQPSLPLISPALSAPSPEAHTNTHATFHYATAADIAALAAQNEKKLQDAAEVIKRDKPKDWLNPGWREQEKREAESRYRAEQEKLAAEERAVKKDMDEIAGVKMKGGENEDVLKRWEWGR